MDTVKSERALDEVVIVVDSDDELEIEAQPAVDTDSTNDAAAINQSPNQSNIDINPENTDIKSELESQRSTEIDSSVPCQSSSSASRMKKKTIPSNFRCEVCQKRFKLTRELVFHRRIHLNDDAEHCRICFCRLTTKAARAAHENNCDTRRYECYLCGRLTMNKLRLFEHMRIHSWQRPFKCILCDATFCRECDHIRHNEQHIKDIFSLRNYVT